MVLLRPNRSKIDGRFLLYALQSAEVQHEIRASEGTGSTVSNLRIPILKTIPVEIPSLPEQRSIAHILGTLDDKIEVNRQMNETLEGIARAIFKSWFVDFDPVRARTEGQDLGLPKETAELFPDRFEDSELGEIPAGWRASTLGELVESQVERVEPSPAKNHEKYIALEDIPARSIDITNYQSGSAVNSSIIAFKKGDILFGSMRPYFHKVGMAFFDGITRTTTFVLRPKQRFLRHFALFYFSSDEVIDYATTASVGTTIPYVKWKSLADYQVPLPQRELLDVFEAISESLTRRIAANGHEFRTLATLRNTLLPRLISRELRVPAPERIIGRPT
jgi:type I restriction enzyme S subunit